LALAKRFYSNSIIEEVRARADIVEVISQYLTLKRSGSGFKALCPFHKEKTPSFNVSPERQIYHCFGCGEGGNVFTFIMKMDGLSFAEAVRTLARRYGVRLTEEMEAQVDERARLRRRLLNLNRRVAAYFHKNLLDVRIGAAARAYLEKRGVSEEAIKRFMIGFAPEGWDNLVGAFGKKQRDRDELSQLGLIIPGERSGFYDRFRGRIIFPILDLNGEIRGFGGRILESSQTKAKAQPKYINSPESPVYRKGRTLFGLYQARDAIRSEGFLVVVEGYMDVIGLFDAGIRNVLATLGTALTAHQCRLIRRFTEKPVVFFDADSAGTSASLRSFDVFWQVGLRPLAFKAPGGDDPDEYVRRIGGERLREQLRSAMPYPEFIIRETLSAADISRVEGKVKVLKEVLPSIAKLETQVEVDHYVRWLAEELKIDPAVAFQELWRLRPGAAPDQALSALDRSQFIGDERDFVRLIMLDERLLSEAVQLVDPEIISDPFLRKLTTLCFEAYHQKGRVDLSCLVERFEGEGEMSFITEVASRQDDSLDARRFRELVASLKRRAIQRRKAEMQRELVRANARGDEKAVDAISREMTRLSRTMI